MRKFLAMLWFGIAWALGRKATEHRIYGNLLLTFEGYKLFGLMAYNKTIVSEIVSLDDVEDDGVRH